MASLSAIHIVKLVLKANFLCKCIYSIKVEKSTFIPLLQSVGSCFVAPQTSWIPVVTKGSAAISQSVHWQKHADLAKEWSLDMWWEG